MSHGGTPIWPNLAQASATSVWTSHGKTPSEAPADFVASLPVAELLPALGGEATRFQSILEVLKQETNPDIFFSGLYRLASDLENQGHLTPSAVLFSSLARADAKKFPVDAALKEKAERRLLAQSGGGASGERIEYLGKRLVEDSISPAMLLGMTGASCVGRFAYGSLLARLSGSAAGSLTRGLTAKALAATGAMALEAPTYAALLRGSQILASHPASSSFFDESLAAFLFIGSMKFAHAGGSAAARGFAARSHFLGSSVPQILLPQATALTGLIAGNFLQKKLGLRPQLKEETWLTDAAASLLHLHVGGFLAGKISGPRVAAWLREAELRAQHTPRPEAKGLTLAMAATGESGAKGMSWMTEGKPPESRPRWSVAAPQDVKIQVMKPPQRATPTHPMTENQIKDLRETARDIPSLLTRIEALVQLAQDSRLSGQAKRAGQLFRESERYAQKLTTPLERSLAFHRIGLEWAKAAEQHRARDSFFRADVESMNWRRNQDAGRFPPTEAYPTLVSLMAEMENAGAAQGIGPIRTLAREFHTRYLPGYAWDDVLEDVAVTHAENGKADLALATASRIEDHQTKLETKLRVGKALLELGEREPVLEILNHLRGMPEEQELLARVSLDFAATGEFQAYHYQAKTIQDPYYKGWALLQASAVMRRRGHTLNAIALNVEGEAHLRQYGSKIDPVRRARLMLMAARNLAQSNQPDEYEATVKAAMSAFSFFLKPGNFRIMPEVKETMGEFLGLMVERYREKDVEGWFRMWNDQIQAELLKDITVRLAAEGSLNQALIWASKAAPAHIDEVRWHLAKEFLRLGLPEEAQELAFRIDKAEWRFELLTKFYRQTPRPEGSSPPSNSGSEGGTPPPSSPLNLGPSGKAFAPLNARSLGSDITAANSRSSAPWELDPALVRQVPWYLLNKGGQESTGFTPLSLSLELSSPGISANRGDAAPLQFSDSQAPEGPPAPANSDRAPRNRIGFGIESRLWASENGFSLAEAKHLEALLHNIYEEMWRILNFQSSTKLAHRIATGQPVTLRISPTSTSLDTYKLEILESPAKSQSKYNMVQWQFHPGDGELKPLEYAAHAAFELRAQGSGADVSRLFIPFYRKIALSSPGLQSEFLVKQLNPLLRNIVLTEPTIEKEAVPPPPPVAKRASERAKSQPVAVAAEPTNPSAPTLLTHYRPLIFAGVEQAVNEYAKEKNLGPDGLRRLQRLTQLIVAALHERETKLHLPENSKLRDSPYLQVFVGPDENGLPERRVEIVTHQEAADREPGDGEIILTLMRYPRAIGDEENYSYLQHNYMDTDTRGYPMGQDLEFQNRLGLPLQTDQGDPQFLHLSLGPYLHLNPVLQPWDEWMAASGFLADGEK